MEMKMIDAASGGALVNMTPTQARELISTMAANSQQFGTTNEPNRRVHEERTDQLEYAKFGHLKDLITPIVIPKIRDGETTRILATHRTRGRTNLTNQGRLHHNHISRQKVHSKSQGKLPSQTEANPRENVSAITLRSGTIVEQQMTPIREKDDAKTGKNDKAIVKKSTSTKEAIDANPREENDATTRRKIMNPIPELAPSPYATQPHFPSRFIKKDKQAEEKEILDVFQKVEINIPLLEVIRKVPRYARFLKELCTNKRKLTGHEKINLREHVSAVLTRRLPPKLKDQGMFAIPCKIGKVGIKRAMCDLGASINVMPLSVYNILSADPLKETKVTIQLADRSIIYPEGVLENILVKVNELIFPADFYVIDMENDRSNTSSEILLGRPFLSTANTKIDV
ncbi:hypothetical protein CXB51_027835 [Gossypium anomalum]|uniref:Aspartic peptidase DDI1-type domain-containing protein n=1 Tax=Gossypium anomalum TaxID=47600 RepID=A0A8J6CS73_9ROSI|nr:hypothetical protein CXB51_027835 [Gossypium anomalum]